jgi:hypothetical protein
LRGERALAGTHQVAHTSETAISIASPIDDYYSRIGDKTPQIIASSGECGLNALATWFFDRRNFLFDA